MTYVEVMLALTILGVVMVGSYRAIISLVRLRKSAHNHYVAVVMANNRVERAKNASFSDLPLLAEDRVPVNELGAPDSNGPFHRSTVITTGHGGDARLTRVVVTVEVPLLSRRDGQRPAESVSTLLTEYIEP
jgi:hypothetical protein